MTKQEKWLAAHPWKRPLEYARRRCRDSKSASWPWYGGKGIACDLTLGEVELLWARDHAALLCRAQLDRKDSNKNYTFDNCRFIEGDANVQLAHQKKDWDGLCETCFVLIEDCACALPSPSPAAPLRLAI